MPPRVTHLTKIPFGANEPLLQRALGAGGIGLWDYLPSTGLVDLYHSVIAFKRLPPGRYYGPIAEFTGFVHAEDKPIVERMLAQCDAGVETVDFQLRIVTTAAAVVWLSCRGERTTLDDGRRRYVGTLANVTDRMEHELRVLQYHESLFTLARNPSVASADDIATATSTIALEAAAQLTVTRTSVWQFLDAECSKLRCKYLYDARDPTSGPRDMELLNASHPIYLEAVRQRRALAISNALDDPTMVEFRQAYLPETGVRALLDVPVFSRGALWGVVCFEDCVSEREWHQEEQAFASSCVDLLSLSLESSQRVRIERELSATRDRHRAFIQASPDPIWCVDIDPPIDTSESPVNQLQLIREHGRVTDANSAFLRDYAIPSQHLVGKSFFAVMPELFKGSSLRDWVERGYRLVDRELVQRPRGEEPANWLSMSLLGVVENGKLIRMWGARRNITDRKRYQSLLEHLAYRDPLTGLLNRQRTVAEITDVLSSRLREPTPEPATLLLIDLNLFKDINDTLGHAAGDEVLRQMRARLEQAIGDTDAVASRLGGDEFSIFARDVGTPEGAIALGDTVGQAMKEPFVIAGGKFHLSASIGAAIFPMHGTTFSELSRAADEAMYHAKNTGGGARLFSRATVVFELRKLGLLARLPAAIESGELALEFQPIINVTTRKPVRMEALVRWNHPEYGRLEAKDFVHKAEMSDSIRMLTRWVIDRATQTCRAWQTVAPEVGVTVNISPRLLGDSDVVAHLQSAVAKNSLPPRMIDLEITETSLIHNQDRAAQVLTDCKALGFAIVIDDYGVGYCSLAYLRRLPLKGLKIDHSFVQRMAHNPEDAIIVHSTITLAHNLGLTVVAEGVEDDTTLAQLQTFGCELAQGFGIAPPMPEARVHDWLRDELGGAPPLRAVN